MLENEIKHFKKVQNQLRTKHPNGGFVVIKNNQVYGVWENRNDALKEGYEKYGDVPFLVKNVNDDLSQAINFPRNFSFPDAISHN